MHRRNLPVVLAFLFLAASLAAEEAEPLTYIAEFRTKPGKESDFINLVKQYDQPMFERLMAEGSVLAWGLDLAVIHREGGPTHSLWWTMPDYAAMDRVFAALAEQEKKFKAEDEQRAAEARRRRQPAPKTVEQEFLEVVELEKHRDFLMRSLLINTKPAPAGALPYTSVASVQVQPGKGEEWLNLWKKYNQPTLDKLVEEGTIFAYGVDREEEHTQEPQWRWIWVVQPNLAATDRIRAAFRADREARSEEEREAISRQFREVTVAGAHRDLLLRAAIYQSE